MPVLLNAITDWYCPNCKLTDRTANTPPGASRLHTCPRLRGLTTPLLRAGTRAKVEARDREDYVGADAGRVQTDADGRPVMSVVTTREDGMDTRVFAPMALGRGSAPSRQPRRIPLPTRPRKGT